MAEGAAHPFVIATASGIENADFYIRELKLDKWSKREHIIYNDGSIRGKVVIVNSNDGDYKFWEGKHPVIKHFNEVNWDWFEG